MMEKKIFITGIAGFIGFHLAKYLHNRGDIVIGCDNFNAYYSPELKRARSDQLKKLGISVHALDIQETNALKDLIHKNHITHIVHLAAQAGVRYSLTHPESYEENNLKGFLSILEICKSHPQIKLTYASSSSVYGLNKKIPFSENDPTDAPTNLYAATKKANELMAHAYHHLYGISVTGLRYFTVYGPWGRPDMAYFLFAKAIQKGEPINVFNHGKMRRDFTYIDDIVEGTAAAIDLESPLEIFNLGNSKTEELETLITLLEKGLQKKAKRISLPMQKGEMMETSADIKKATAKLGFSPKVSLETGIIYFTSWINHPELY